MKSFIERFAIAIATMEGFYSLKKSIAYRNNNPGNLRSWGKNPIVNGYAKFATIEEGWKALRTQIRKNISRGLTTKEFFAGKPGIYAGYSPSEDNNDPVSYADFIAQRLGIDPNVPLKNYIERS